MPRHRRPEEQPALLGRLLVETLSGSPLRPSRHRHERTRQGDQRIYKSIVQRASAAAL